VIGLGKMGILHSGIVNSLPDARIRAICEKETLLIRAARALLPKTINFYKDHVRMVQKEELDAVFITTPIITHVPLVVDLARADRDVSLFVEKPLAGSYEQAQMACDAVRSSRGVHMVGFQKRFSHVFQKAKQFIESGSLGNLMFFRAYSFSSDVLREGASWRFRRAGGGVLLDLAPHLLDILVWFFGDPVVLAATKRRLYSREVDDYVHAILSFETGLKGHMDACWSIPSFRLPEISIEVHGKNAMLVVTDDFVKIKSNKDGGTRSGGSQMYLKQSFDTCVPFLLADPEFTREDETFLSAVHKRTMTDPNFFNAAKVNDVIDRIENSASS